MTETTLIGFVEITAGDAIDLCDGYFQYRRNRIENDRLEFIESMLLQCKPKFWFFRGDRYTLNEAKELWTKPSEDMWFGSPKEEAEWQGSRSAAKMIRLKNSMKAIPFNRFIQLEIETHSFLVTHQPEKG